MSVDEDKADYSLFVILLMLFGKGDNPLYFIEKIIKEKEIDRNKPYSGYICSCGHSYAFNIPDKVDGKVIIDGINKFGSPPVCSKCGKVVTVTTGI